MDKGITISQDGHDVPVYLLDESQYVFKVSPATTAGSLCLALRVELGLKYDAHYSLFMFNTIDEGFKHIDDQIVIAKLVAKWQQSDFDGSSLYVFH